MADAAANALQFFKFVGQLKRTVRTGWVNHNVREPESVAEHMYRMALMTFMIDESASETADVCINKDRCMRLALVHDLAECIVGDITPYQGITKEEKTTLERSAMQKITCDIPNQVAAEVMSLWQEYELQITAESRFVKDLDRFEMILQAFEYEQEQERPKELQDFFNSTNGKFCSPLVKSWVDQLLNQRSNCTAQSSTQVRSEL